MVKREDIPVRSPSGIEQIYSDPFTEATFDLQSRFSSNVLDRAGLNRFLNNLPAATGAEREKIERLIAGHSLTAEADLSSRAGQLAWAAALAHISQGNAADAVRSHPVWRTLTRHPQLSGTLGTAARYVDLSVSNRDATIGWGVPGSGFWFDHEKNHINVDLFRTLIGGFHKDPAPGVKGPAHIIGSVLREVGRSQLTTRFTDNMIALQKREKELLDSAKTRKLNDEEFLRLTRIRAEFQMRLELMDSIEESCANVYAARQGAELPYNIPHSQNVDMTLSQGTARSEEQNASGKPKEIANARESFTGLCNALKLSYFTTSGLFHAGDKETWKKLGVNPDNIHAGESSRAEEDFDRLIQSVAGAGGVSSLQPSKRDRWTLQSIFTHNVQAFADRRCAIIDQIWDQYAARHAQVLVDAVGQDAENELNKKKGKKSDKKDKGSGESDSDKDGGGSSEKKNKQKSSSGQPKQKDSAKDKQDSQGKEGDPADDKKVDVEGAGKMDTGNKPIPATPEQTRKDARKSGDDGSKPEDEKTVRDLARESKKEEKKSSAPIDGTKGTGEDKKSHSDFKSDAGSTGGRGKGIDLASLAGGDWTEFRLRINELEPVLDQIVPDLSYIRNMQHQTVSTMSSEREELPRDSKILKRLHMPSHVNLALKLSTGQRIETADRRRWRKTDVTTENTSVELWILGDGSESMEETLNGRVRRIDSTIQTMAVLQVGGYRSQFDTFSGIWGDDNLRLLAAPGYDDQAIGMNFERVRNGIKSGTHLSPSFAQAIARSAKQDTTADGKLKRFAGMTHFLIISDGELDKEDIKPMVNLLSMLFKHGPAVSVDIAVLGNVTAEMGQVVNAVKEINPAAPLSIIKSTNPSVIPILLVQQIKQRFIQASQDFMVMPDSQKREAFENVYRALQPGRP